MSTLDEKFSPLRLLAALIDETDPVLVRLVDRARRVDGLLPTRAALEAGPLSVAGDSVELFYLGAASDEDYLHAQTACEAMCAFGTTAERELATLSLAVLEASSIVYRQRFIVSRTTVEADARLASAAAASIAPWQRLVASAMRATMRISA
jgi:hypothetical protein